MEWIEPKLVKLVCYDLQSSFSDLEPVVSTLFKIMLLLPLLHIQFLQHLYTAIHDFCSWILGSPACALT